MAQGITSLIKHWVGFKTLHISLRLSNRSRQGHHQLFLAVSQASGITIWSPISILDCREQSSEGWQKVVREEKKKTLVIWKLTQDGEKDREKKHWKFCTGLFIAGKTSLNYSTDILTRTVPGKWGSRLVELHKRSSHSQNILSKKCHLGWRHSSGDKGPCHQTSWPEFNPGIHIREGENQIR